MGADGRYGKAEAVTFRFPKIKPENRKRSIKTMISVGTCEPCRRERYVHLLYFRYIYLMNRLSDFDETTIYLKLERTSIPTSRRSKNKEVSHQVQKTTSVLDIKVEVGTYPHHNSHHEVS